MQERQSLLLPRNSKDAMVWEQYVLVALLTAPQKNPSYLDIGCYDAKRTVQRAHLLGTTNTVGMDYVPQRLSVAQATQAKIVCADANESLPFRGGSFDVITATQVIEDLFEPDDFLCEIKRLLTPYGYAIITTNNLAAFHHRIELAFGIQPRCMSPSRYSHKPAEDGTYLGHKSLFTYTHLKEVLQRHRFTILNSGTHTIYPLPARLSQAITSFFPNIGAYSYFKIALPGSK